MKTKQFGTVFNVHAVQRENTAIGNASANFRVPCLLFVQKKTKTNSPFCLEGPIFKQCSRSTSNQPAHFRDAIK